MKKIFLLSFGIAAFFAVDAQVKPAVEKTSTPRTVLTVSPSSIEASIVQGPFIMNKMLKQVSDGKDFTASYTISKNDAGFNTRNPIAVTLSKDSFDTFINGSAGLSAAQKNQVNKYVSENKLSLSDEKSWVSAMNYVNLIK